MCNTNQPLFVRRTYTAWTLWKWIRMPVYIDRRGARRASKHYTLFDSLWSVLNVSKAESPFCFELFLTSFEWQTKKNMKINCIIRHCIFPHQQVCLHHLILIPMTISIGKLIFVFFIQIWMNENKNTSKREDVIDSRQYQWWLVMTLRTYTVYTVEWKSHVPSHVLIITTHYLIYILYYPWSGQTDFVQSFFFHFCFLNSHLCCRSTLRTLSVICSKSIHTKLTCQIREANMRRKKKTTKTQTSVTNLVWNFSVEIFNFDVQCNRLLVECVCGNVDKNTNFRATAMTLPFRHRQFHSSIIECLLLLLAMPPPQTLLHCRLLIDFESEMCTMTKLSRII